MKPSAKTLCAWLIAGHAKSKDVVIKFRSCISPPPAIAHAARLTESLQEGTRGRASFKVLPVFCLREAVPVCRVILRIPLT
jgi:hypothetical protein